MKKIKHEKNILVYYPDPLASHHHKDFPVLNFQHFEAKPVIHPFGRRRSPILLVLRNIFTDMQLSANAE